jgi:hypothetical protein
MISNPGLNIHVDIGIVHIETPGTDPSTGTYGDIWCRGVHIPRKIRLFIGIWPWASPWGPEPADIPYHQDYDDDNDQAINPEAWN